MAYQIISAAGNIHKFWRRTSSNIVDAKEIGRIEPTDHIVPAGPYRCILKMTLGIH